MSTSHQLQAIADPDSEQTRLDGRAIVVLMGAVLLACSLIAYQVFASEIHGTLLAMVAALLLGMPIVWRAVLDVFHRNESSASSHMEELVAIAIVASFASTQYLEAGAVALFMLLATFIEDRTAAGARQTIESLIRITPTKARRLVNGKEAEVPARELAVGDVVVVAPGDNIPCDGTVVDGASAVDEKSITGESLPVDKTPGDAVFAGSINQSGTMQIRVEKSVEDSTLGRVQSLILQAASSKTPITRMLDRYAGHYTPTVLMVAAIVFFFTRDLDRAISLLLIACPCAIILSVPTALVAALSAAARLGVLIKNVTDIEVARRLTCIVFDKTGTLTTGHLTVTRLNPIEGTDPAELLRCAASLEAHSRHPVARAVMSVAERAQLKPEDVEAFEEVAGRGVRGTISGNNVMAGREAWLREQDVQIAPDVLADTGGLSILLVARAGTCIGWIGMEDQARHGAGPVLTDLDGLGVGERLMVTGDRTEPAERVAAGLKLTSVHAEALPGDKLQTVKQLKERGHTVAVIGDGVNDGPALAAADLSVAMGAAGSDVAINAASIALMNSQLNRLPFLIRLSRATTRVIRQNIVFVMLYIVVMLALLAFGYVTPLIAAIAHGLSSIVVVFNSARLIREGEDLPLSEEAEQQQGEDGAWRPRTQAAAV